MRKQFRPNRPPAYFSSAGTVSHEAAARCSPPEPDHSDQSGRVVRAFRSSAMAARTLPQLLTDLERKGKSLPGR
jgi:hypothetical protein